MLAGLRPCLSALLFIAAAGAGFAATPELLTEQAAIAAALAQPAFRDAEQGRLVTAQSAVTEARLYPNPQVALGYERLGAPGGHASESTAQISQTFDISGRRGLLQDAAGSRASAAERDRRDREQKLIGEVRRAFADALHRERSKDSAAAWLARLEEATTVVARLTRAGEASGYDRRRVEREMHLARAKLLTADADLARARENLAGLLGAPSGSFRLAGELDPPPPPPLADLQARLRERPDLASLAAQAEAFDHERLAAERRWIPDMTLGVGHKRTDETGRSENGVILSFSVPLPVFDRGQAGEQKARGQAMTLRAERDLQLARAEGELRGLWRQAAQLHEAVVAFRTQTAAGSRELSRIAQASYRAGEGGILELLDAYRAELDATLTELDLALRARTARIELDALAGVHPHE
jgi:outer membrane protein, heavy metal efflux system